MKDSPFSWLTPARFLLWGLVWATILEATHSLVAHIDYHQVSYSFPPSLWRTLTSSEPRRSRALDEVNWSTQGPAVVLVTGPSSCGKSLLLKLLNKRYSDESLQGQITVQGGTPVYLWSRPSFRQNARVSDVLKGDSFVFLTLGLKEDDRVGQLSMSDVYRLAMGQAWIESCNGVPTQHPPILILDEWLDAESSTIIQSIEVTMHDIVEATGGILLVVTHHPDRFRAAHCGRLRMRRGTIESYVPPSSVERHNS